MLKNMKYLLKLNLIVTFLNEIALHSKNLIKNPI